MSLIWRFPYKPIFFNSLRSFTSLGSHFDADELSQLPSPQIFCNSLKHNRLSILTTLVAGLHLQRARYSSPLCPRAAKPSLSCSA